MTTFQKTIVTGSMLLLGLGIPGTALAANGCNNGYLLGHYNAQSSSLNVVTLAASLNNTDLSKAPSGFSNNASSLSGKTPALGRYYLDGNGNILGTATAGNPVIGTYSVSNDCTAKLTFKNGRTFNGVVAGQGQELLYVGTDANGIGITGRLDRSANYCISSQSGSFAFQYYGGAQASGVVQPYATVGTLVIDGSGNFKVNAWTSANGAAQQFTGGGTYSISTNCSLSLTFKGDSAKSAPAAVNVLLPQNGSDSTGVLEVEPVAGLVLTGTLIPQ
jgi:hypothetical protein